MRASRCSATVVLLSIGSSFGSAAAADPKADQLVADGFEQLRANDPNAAEKSFRAALKEDRNAVGAYFGRAMVAAGEANYSRAAQYFERELKNAPTVGETYNNAGVMQAQQRKHVAAVIHFAEAADRLGLGVVSRRALAAGDAPRSPADEAQIRLLESLFDNFGRTLDEYFTELDSSRTAPPEVEQALRVFEDLERVISMSPPTPGLVRFGSKWITADERDRIDRQNGLIDSQIAAERQSIEQLLIDGRAIEGEIEAYEQQLIRLRHHWDYYPALRTRYKWNQIVAIETEIERLIGRLAGIQESIDSLNNAIVQLNAQRVRPSWFTQFVLLDWPGPLGAAAPSAGP